jgi:hypothetical protein
VTRIVNNISGSSSTESQHVSPVPPDSTLSWLQIWLHAADAVFEQPPTSSARAIASWLSGVARYATHWRVTQSHAPRADRQVEGPLEGLQGVRQGEEAGSSRRKD